MKKATIIGLMALVLTTPACDCHLNGYECDDAAEKLQKVAGLETTPKTLYHGGCKVYFRGEWRSGTDIVKFISTETEPKALK